MLIDDYVIIIGNTVSSAAKTLKNTYGNNVVNEKNLQKVVFKKDDFSLKDERQTESRMLKKTQF
ncbi:hypothetical protein ACTXT7_009708 [Hymenolepis weldensis]